MILKLKSAQSDYHGGQINFARRIAYRYCDTYTGKQGVTVLLGHLFVAAGPKGSRIVIFSLSLKITLKY